MNDFKHYRGRGRGQFPHNNFRGNIFNNVRRSNPNAFSPLLPLPPFRDNKHRWTRPQHNPMWQRPPRMPPFLRPPGMPSQLPPPFIQDTKPPSPLPGSEEARQKAIAEASARIKQQLNLNENESAGVTSEQIPLPNYTSFSDNKFEEIEEIPNNRLEKNLKKRNRKATESTHSVEELRNKILTQFTSMSKGKIQNLVNNPGSSKYDNYLHHLVRDMRLHLSTELRNMYNNRENDTENNEMIDHFNSIVPDLGVELVSLPDTMVAELSKILQFDINEQNNEPLVEPEHMFKQAEKLLLNTEYLNNSYEICESQVSDNFSPDSTANLMQNNLDSQNPLCNKSPTNHLYTGAADVLETTDMEIDSIAASKQDAINTQILSSQDSSSNLDEIPLPDFNQQVPSRTSTPLRKKMFDTNSLPDSTNIIDDHRIATSCSPLDKSHETSIWVFQQQHNHVSNDLSKELCDSTRSETNTVLNINESPIIKPEPDPDPDLDETCKRNRLPLDERIKMMMKMQESSPRKQQEDKVQVYKSKNQKKKERKRLKLLQKKEQEKIKVKVQIENSNNSQSTHSPIDYHLDVVVKQEIFDEKEMDETQINLNETNSMDTFIKHVKELNESLNNKPLSSNELHSPRPLIEVRKNLMPSPTLDNNENQKIETLQNNETISTGNNDEQEQERNECETTMEQSGNEIPVTIHDTCNDPSTDQLEDNSKQVTEQCELQNTLVIFTCENVGIERTENQDRIRKQINEIENTQVQVKSGGELNEQQNETVSAVLNEEDKSQESPTVLQDKILEDTNNQEKCIEDSNTYNCQEYCVKENIEITEEKVEENMIDVVTQINLQKQKEEVDIALKNTEELKTDTQKENEEKTEEKKETQETERDNTQEQPCNMNNNENTVKLEICDKVIKENSILNKVEKQTQNKVEKESSRKHKSEDKKRDKSLEKDHKKSDGGYSVERKVSDRHYRHKSKEKHKESRDVESSKYKSDKSKSKSKTEQKASGKSPKKSDDRKENKIDFEVTGDTSKMLNRLMEIDLQIEKLMQEKFNIYQKINFTTQHTSILTSAIPELQQTVQISKSTNSQRAAEDTEEKDIDKNNKTKASLEMETAKKLRKRKRSPTPHHSPDIEQKKCNENEIKTESDKPFKKKGKFDKKSEAKNLKKTTNKETVCENHVPVNETIIESTFVSDKDVKENKKSSKNDKKDKKKLNDNPCTVVNMSDDLMLDNSEKVENKLPKKRRTKANQTLNENVIEEPNKKILIKIKKPVKKTSKKLTEDIETQVTKSEIVELENQHEFTEIENKIEPVLEIKEKKSKKKRKGEIINNNIEESKIKTETTNNNREESNECIESYNNNNENTEYKIKLKVSEPSSDNKSIRLKIIKSEIRKEDLENDKLSTLRRSRRNTSEEIQNSEKIIRPSSLPKKKRKPDEENRRSRSRSMSKDPEKKQKKYETSDDDEPLGRQVKRKPFSGSDSESSCIDEKRVDKKINAKRKTRRLSRDSDISISESVKSNKSVPENNPLINCFVKLERCDVNTNSATPEEMNSSSTLISDRPEDVDKDIRDIIANLDDNFEDSVGELEEFHVNTENSKQRELEMNSIENEPTGIFCAGHRKSILDIKILGDEFLAASEDGTIYKYCLKTGELQDAYTGHNRAVTCIHLMAGSVLDISSSLLYSGSLDCTLRCFNLDTAEILHSVTVEQAIQCMDSAWGHIFLGTYEGLLFIYNIKKKLLNDQSLTIANATVLMIKATTEGSRQVLILASRKREIMVRDAFTGLLLRTMCQDQKPTIYSLLLDKSMVYCGTSDQGIFILDFNNGTQTGLYSSGKGVVCMVMYKNLLFAGCYDGMIYVYDSKTQTHVSSISGPGDGMLLSLAISHDMIIAGTKKEHLLKIWKIPQEILNQIHQ